MALEQYLQGINNATAGQTADVNTASSDLSSLQVGAGSLPAKLKEALNTKLNNNKDIINQQSETMQNYFNSGAQAREKYQDVWDPFKKATLVQQDRSMALRPYDTLSGVLENRMGTVADTVTAGVQGWQGMVDAGTTKLDTAKSMLTTALSSYLSAADQQSAADDMAYKVAQAEEASRQFEKNYGLESRKIDVNESQFAAEMALKKLGLGSDGAKTAAESAKLTDSIWQTISKDPNTGKSLPPEQVWQNIHNNEASWGAMGVNMNTIWAGYKAMGGGSSSPITQLSASKIKSIPFTATPLNDPLASYKGIKQTDYSGVNLNPTTKSGLYLTGSK